MVNKKHLVFLFQVCLLLYVIVPLTLCKNYLNQNYSNILNILLLSMPNMQPQCFFIIKIGRDIVIYEYYITRKLCR